MSLFSCSYSFSLYKSRKPCTLYWYAKYCKSERSNPIRWRYVLHLFCSTFWNTGNGNILPLFAFRRKTKNPDFAWGSGFYYLLLFFKVVPPGIEPGTQGFSVLCSTNWATEAKWRPGWDSNPRPPPWQGGILTNWTTGPLVGLHKTSTKIKNGGRWRDRTADILLVRQTLSQLS